MRETRINSVICLLSRCVLLTVRTAASMPKPRRGLKTHLCHATPKINFFHLKKGNRACESYNKRLYPR